MPKLLSFISPACRFVLSSGSAWKRLIYALVHSTREVSLMKSRNGVKEKRKKLIEELQPGELEFMKEKLKKEHSGLAKQAEEEEEEQEEKRMLSEDDEFEAELKDKRIEEGLEEGFIRKEKPEEVYDEEEAEELVEDDEINAAEAGFVRGFEKEEEGHFSKKKKKAKK